MRVLGRAILVIGTLLAAGALAVWQLGPTIRDSVGVVAMHGTHPSRALVAWVALVCAGLAGGWWLWVVGSSVATTLAALGTSRLPRWLLAPRVLRAALGLVVGTTVSTFAVSPPSSSASLADAHPRPGPDLPGALVGLQLPDRVVGGPPRRRPSRVHSGSHTARVRSGDSLWSITADLLNSPAPAFVARGWPRLYVANREVIGPDPNLIRPGMRLVVPAPLHRHDRGEPR